MTAPQSEPPKSERTRDRILARVIEARWAQSLFLAPWKLVALTTRETDYAPDGGCCSTGPW